MIKMIEIQSVSIVFLAITIDFVSGYDACIDN